MSLRERLENIAKKVCAEAVESSADMIADNTVASFDDMGMATVKPGEFAQEEITDQENLVNKANMSNDNNFNKDECDIANIADQMLDDMLDISDPEADIEITTIVDNEKCPNGHKCHHKFGESTLAKALNKVLNGRTFEQYLKEATDYTGPKDWNPDMRINVSEVLNTLKDEIGEGSEGIHVDQLYDNQKNDCYKVSQIDKSKLPETLTVSNIKLVLDGDTYKKDSKSKDFPLTK